MNFGGNKMVNVRKRGNFYQYQFEVAPINGKRKQVAKSKIFTNFHITDNENIQ